MAERVDLAVRLAPTVEGDLIATKLMDTRYRVVASPAYLAAHAPLTVPADLSAHRVLLFNLRAYRTRWLFPRRGGAGGGGRHRRRRDAGPGRIAVRAALAGLGPALLPDWLVDEAVARGELIDVFPLHAAATATTFDTAAWLVYPSRAYLPNKVRVMIDFLKEAMTRR